MTAAFVEQSVGPVAPGIVQYTSDPLFHDLWLRPALAPRDRSLGRAIFGLPQQGNR